MAERDPERTRRVRGRGRKPPTQRSPGSEGLGEDDATLLEDDSPRSEAGPAEPSFDAMSVLGELAGGQLVDHVVELNDPARTAGRDAEPAPKSGDSKYQVRRLLGRGGMGSVYLVRDGDLRRHVAMKTALGRGSKLLTRFVDEAQVMGQLQHPGIVPVHELGLTREGRPYYTMPVVRGRTVREILDELIAGRPEAVEEWTLTRLVQVFLQVCQAVDYAHSRGVLHRDIKPANVMVGSHGEVQLLDWGLAKVVQASGIETTLGSEDDTGLVLGSPAYMAPEQAAGERVDARADVYALGSLLFELLTRQVPFPRPDVDSVLEAVRTEPPPRPRRIVEGVPRALEEACLKALRKRPEDRFSSAGELSEAVQDWLESEADKSRRRELADEKAALGRRRLEEYFELKERVKECAAEVGRTKGAFRPWEPLGKKRPFFAAEEAEREAHAALAAKASEVVSTLSEALGFDREHAAAGEALADYYWDRLLQSEERGDLADAAFYERLVASHHDGKYERQLLGTGSLQLDSDPPGAEVWLHDLVEEELVLRERRARRVGVTPLPRTELPMGSYLVVLRKEGYRDTRYPVHVSRNREWSGSVRLLTDQQVGAGWCYVPAGPARLGGDPACMGHALPAGDEHVPGFLVAEQALTAGDYLQFVNAILEGEGRAAAVRRAPRGARNPEAGHCFLDFRDGRFAFDRDDRDGSGRILQPGYPVLNVSADDALAYCAWRSELEGRELRLLEEKEYEKAARGVDGRWYPWGDRFDATLCNMVGSFEGPAKILSVDDYAAAFPDDRSIYGARALAGNMRCWTGTRCRGGSEGFVVRGGCWGADSTTSRCARRLCCERGLVNGHVGFRLARPLP